MVVGAIGMRQAFSVPCAEVYPWLSVPERMSTWTWGMALHRSADSPIPGDPDGVGSRRVVTWLGLSWLDLTCFEETILVAEPPHRFEYSITRGSPVIGQRGQQRLSPTPTGCVLDWNIRFEPRVPFTTWPIRTFTEQHFLLCLRGLARRLALGTSLVSP